ncbi:MAG: hypothetical protein ACJAXT_000356 [Paracoccaceae bacterium]|jgi:hypothetical protein
MAQQVIGYFEKRRTDRSLKRWAKLSERALSLPPNQLKSLHSQASALRRKLERFSITAEARLMEVPPQHDGIVRPDQCDWAYRPQPWVKPMIPAGQVGVPSPQSMGTEMKLFHDSPDSEVTYRQIRNNRPGSVAQFGLRLDVLRFGGSFLSLVQDFPIEAVQGLTRNHILNVSLDLDLEHPLEVYARLNIQHGPNTEQMVRELSKTGPLTVAEFDLAYSNINEKRLEKMWVDLIFEGPKMNQISINDFTLTRAPRADL